MDVSVNRFEFWTMMLSLFLIIGALAFVSLRIMRLVMALIYQIFW